MKILLIMNGGFGDVSWTTSWPRIFSENGHEIDVFLMGYTGNPYHANPYIKKMVVSPYMNAAKEILPVIEETSYDIILIPNNNMGGMVEMRKVMENIKNVNFFVGASVSQIVSGLCIPRLKKPEWFFTKKESSYIENYTDLKDAILFHPYSSSIKEKEILTWI